MRRLLLDTNAYSELRRGHAKVSQLVRAAQRILFSTVVAGELLYGFRRGKRLADNLADLQAFLDSPYVELLTVTWTTADRFARIAAALRAQGKPIPTNDIWIAAHTMECGADLVSFDRHFGAIAGLVWIDPG